MTAEAASARRSPRVNGRRPPARADPPTATRRRPRVVRQLDRGAPRADVHELAAAWRGAFEAADSALAAAGESLPPAELSTRRQALVAERSETLRLLRAVAREHGETPRYLHLRPRRELRTLLALPPGVSACVFELDGVLVPSAELHVTAWEQTFEELVLHRRDALGEHVHPFHRSTDYARHIHGKPRLEGVRAFVESRGLTLPLGEPRDPPGAETIHGLANRKNDLLLHLLDARGVHAYDDSRRYVELVVEAGLRIAVVSASANTPRILERTGLSAHVDACVDGRTMVAKQLRKRPAPDVLVAACRELGVEPGAAAAYETTAEGVAAARVAGFGVVVAVERGGGAGSFRAVHPDVLTQDLGALLERGIVS